jgi:LmbE family N-acetylglucosaminyl deacetylase
MLSRLRDSRRLLALSPHLDDAALSIGGALAEAAKAGTDVVVGTVFTGDAPSTASPSPIIEELNALWKLGPSPMAARRKEDADAMQVLGARYVHGGLPDAIYRTNRDGASLYATRQAIFSEPSPEDDVVLALSKLLADWIEENQPDIVLCPLAVGRHVDHVSTAKAFHEVAVDRHLNILLYEDLPYATGFFPPGFPDSVEKALARTNWRVERSEEVAVDFSRKIASVRKYRSQINGLFSDDRQMEITLAQYMSSAAQDSLSCERLWEVST